MLYALLDRFHWGIKRLGRILNIKQSSVICRSWNVVRNHCQTQSGSPEDMDALAYSRCLQRKLISASRKEVGGSGYDIGH